MGYTSLSDEERELLDKYDSYEAVNGREELYEYLQAFTTMVAVMEPRTEVTTKLLKINGIANDLRDGEISVDEAKEQAGEYIDGGD